METQDQLVSGVRQLVSSVNRLVEQLEAPTIGQPRIRKPTKDDFLPAPLPNDTLPEARNAQQEVQLGYEIDQCSGNLSVWDRFDHLVGITRGQWTTIDVAIDGDGWWYWRCNDSHERARGDGNFRQRVKRLKILHSLGTRQITWWCFDLL